ncbi:Undecaprenyl-phosphate 4-deoxy-4-formamido-L-arabinose transferase [Streptomyces griseomycini]
MLAGLRMSRGAAVVIMDADLQHPPELIPRMLELHRHGYDQVIPRRDRTGEGVSAARSATPTTRSSAAAWTWS